jgi:hypothetical protein
VVVEDTVELVVGKAADRTSSEDEIEADVVAAVFVNVGDEFEFAVAGAVAVVLVKNLFSQKFLLDYHSYYLHYVKW